MKISLVAMIIILCTQFIYAQGNQEPKKTKTDYLQNYLLFLPADYNKDLRPWPLMIFLHGSGERGDDISLVKTHGPPKIVEQDKNFPFMLVSPQCPANRWWNPGELKLLIDEVCHHHRVDPQRIYLTGLSMGGYGTWEMAMHYPELFAAVAPICGGGDPDNACRLKNIPVWAFHGGEDHVVLPKKSEEMVEAVKACGGAVKYTLYPEAGHDSWTETYDNPDLYQWFLSLQKSSRWDKDFEKFEKEDATRAPLPGGVVFTGSSSIKKWKTLSKDFPRLKLINRGLEGSQIGDLVRYHLKVMVQYQPKTLVIYSGENDIDSGKSPREVSRDFITLFGIVRDYLPETRIVFISIKPSPARKEKIEEIQKANLAISEFLAKQDNAYFVDVFNAMLDKDGSPKTDLFAEDKGQINEQGYKLWKKMLKPYLE